MRGHAPEQAFSIAETASASGPQFGGADRHGPGGLKMTRSEAERARQFKKANRHWYLVWFLKLTFPVLAMAAGSLYFIDSVMKNGLEVDVGDAKLSIKKIVVQNGAPKMINPVMQGFDKKQGTYLVTAKSAEQQDVKVMHVFNLTGIDAKVTHPDKTVSTLVSDSGVFDSKAEVLKLKGNITAVMNGDMTVKMRSARLKMKSKILRSNEPVEVEMINGTVTANTLFVNSNKKRLLFKGRVQVTIKSLGREKSSETKNAVPKALKSLAPATAKTAP